MTPVCPACRAALYLDSYACWRCGLAVRPTCSVCGEPLMHGMDVCWFCREPVTEPPEIERSEIVAQAAAAPTAPAVTTVRAPETTVPTAEPIVEAEPEHTYAPSIGEQVALRSRERRRSPRRMRKGRVFVLSLVLGLLVAAGAVAFEASSARHVPPPAASVRFDAVSLAAIGCDVSYPEDWRVDEAKRHASFLSDEREGDLSLRGFRVTRAALRFGDVGAELAKQDAKFRTYDELSRRPDSVDRHEAVKVVFLGNGLRFEQWWIEVGKRTTLRVDLWSRPADDEALDVNVRIMKSLDVK